MTEYVEKSIVDAVIRKRAFGKCEMCKNLEFCHSRKGSHKACWVQIELPTADVAPVRHGKWEGTADGYADEQLVYDTWNCSECGYDADGAEEEPQWEFCPFCGARMDGGAENG